MSFSLSISNVDVLRVAAEVVLAGDRFLDEQRKQNAGKLPVGFCEGEFRQSVETAAKVAQVMAGHNEGLSGCRPEWLCNVSVSGHVNPGNVPTAGWGNDYLMVSVSNASRSVETLKAENEAAELARGVEADVLRPLIDELGYEEVRRLLAPFVEKVAVPNGLAVPDHLDVATHNAVVAAAVAGKSADMAALVARAEAEIAERRAELAGPLVVPASDADVEWAALSEDEQIEVLVYLDEVAGSEVPDLGLGGGDLGGSSDTAPQEPADPDLADATYDDVGAGEVDADPSDGVAAPAAADVVVAELD